MIDLDRGPIWSNLGKNLSEMGWFWKS